MDCRGRVPRGGALGGHSCQDLRWGHVVLPVALSFLLLGRGLRLVRLDLFLGLEQLGLAVGTEWVRRGLG
eukprot:1182770-Prorocentrum_minimum.AAC.6